MELKTTKEHYTWLCKDTNDEAFQFIKKKQPTEMYSKLADRIDSNSSPTR